MRPIVNWKRLMTIAGLAAALWATPASTAIAGGDCCDDGCGSKDAASAKTPEECFDAVRKAIIAKDGKAFFALLAEDSQKCMERQGEALRSPDAGSIEETAKALGVTVDEMKKMPAQDVSIGFMMSKVTDEQRKALETATLADLKVDGDKASATRVAGEEKKPVYFVKTKEGWKYDLELTNGCKAPEEKKDDGCCEGSDKK